MSDQVELSENMESIISSVENMTVLELSKLVKALEDRLGVSAAAPQAVVAAAPQGGGDAAAEQTEFEVVLAEVGQNKIQVIKAVRAATGLGLKEAKEIVDGAPKSIKQGVSKEDAEALKASLEEAGATIEVK